MCHRMNFVNWTCSCSFFAMDVFMLAHVGDGFSSLGHSMGLLGCCDLGNQHPNWETDITDSQKPSLLWNLPYWSNHYPDFHTVFIPSAYVHAFIHKCNHTVCSFVSRFLDSTLSRWHWFVLQPVVVNHSFSLLHNISLHLNTKSLFLTAVQYPNMWV